MLSLLPARSSGRIVLAGQSRPACAAPLLRRPGRSIRAVHNSATSEQDVQAELVKATALTSVVGTFLAAGNVSAAQEIADIAAGDNRLGLVALVALPALAWVGYNIFGPAITQLQQMQKKAGASRSVMGLGLGLATLLAAQQASASSEIAQLAAGDNRLGIIVVILLPVIAWVLFNILGPAKAQLDNMATKRRGVAGAVGLSAAALLAAQQADAASEVSQLAAGDNRLGIIVVVLIPVLGWVLFNILGPAKAQLDNMGRKRRGIAGAVGLSAAALLAAQQADAASEVSQLAAGDNRLGIIVVVLIPVLGWVLFNILGPAKAQLDNMGKKRR